MLARLAMMEMTWIPVDAKDHILDGHTGFFHSMTKPVHEMHNLLHVSTLRGMF